MDPEAATRFRMPASTSCCFCARVRRSAVVSSGASGSHGSTVSASVSSNTGPDGIGAPSTLGFSSLSKSNCSSAATSGRKLPRPGTSPSRHIPNVKPRFRIARSSRGSAPSWSRYIAHTVAIARRSSAHAGGAASAPSPRAVAASSSSAARTSAVPAAHDSNGPATATTPSTPTSPVASASRIAGNRAGSTSPDVSATGFTTARPAFTSSPARCFDTRVTRCTSSLGDPHPNRVVIRSAFSRPSERSQTCPVVSTSRASPARTIRAAAAITSRTSVSDRPRAAPGERLADHIEEVVADPLEGCRDAVHTLHSGGGLRHPSALKGPDQEPNQALCKLDFSSTLWRSRCAEFRPLLTQKKSANPSSSRSTSPRSLYGARPTRIPPSTGTPSARNGS